MVGLTGHRGISVYLWFLMIVGLMHTPLCMVKRFKACSTSTSCKGMSLTCDDHQRIRLLDQLYNYSNNSTHCKCSSSSSCDALNSDNCSVIEDTNCQKSFSRLHAYNLYSRCSGMESICQIQVQRGGGHTCANTRSTIIPDSNIVTYDCVKDEDIVHFCDEVSVTGTSVHVIFNGTETNKVYTDQTCSCTITGDINVPLTIHSEDIRYYRVGYPTQCASVKVSGVEQQCNISQGNNFIYQTPWDNTQNVITLENLFELGKDDKPTMVWIRVDGQGNPVTVQCNGAVTPPPVGCQGSGSSVGDKGGMVAAIVVPILLIVIGIAIALGILYWRKRRQQNANQTTGIANGAQAHTYANTTGDNHTSTTASTSEHTYNYLDFSADQHSDEYASVDSTAISPYPLEI